MDKVTLEQKYIGFMKKNNIHSLKNTNQKYFYMPYKSDKKNIRVYIFANIIDEMNTIKFGFQGILKVDKRNLDETREHLLDLNSRLTTGALSLKKNSNVVEYSINYTVEDDEDIDIERYNRIIVFCMNLYFDLYDRKIIERENFVDE